MINNRSTPAATRPSMVKSLSLVCMTLTLSSCSSLVAKLPWFDKDPVDPAPVVVETPAPRTSPKSIVSQSVAAPQGNDAQVMIKQNMYDSKESNYSNLLTDYEEVEQSVLVFPNDSLLLGDANKQIIEQYVDSMDPSTDVLSVIGCSHGQTAINNGNSLLALGRANRVKEAFLFSGVDHTDVLEEGCWAPTLYDEVMPRRGVLLTLKRRKDS